MTQPKPRANYEALRVEYVNGTMSLRELAASHGLKAAGVMNRAAKAKWEDERKRRQAELSKAADEKIIETSIDELTQFNADDLKMAKAIRGRAAMLMQKVNTLTATELRALASAADTAQKIGRLALGAETARTVNENRNLSPITDEDWL